MQSEAYLLLAGLKSAFFGQWVPKGSRDFGFPHDIAPIFCKFPLIISTKERLSRIWTRRGADVNVWITMRIFHPPPEIRVDYFIVVF